MRLSALYEASPGQIHRPGPTMNVARPMGKRFKDLRSAMRLIYGEPTDTKDSVRAGVGRRPTPPGVGQLPQAYHEPGARSSDAHGDPQGTGGGTGIPWKPRHRRFLGVNPSA